MSYWGFILQDWKANKNNSKGRLLLFLFRIANYGLSSKVYRVIFSPYIFLYKIFVGWFLGIEIPWNTKIGSNLKLFHGQALVINKHTVIGDNCSIRHCTTIGNKQLENGTFSGSPFIGNNVDIGCNVCIIGPVSICDNTKIGSGSVVTKSVLHECIVVGNPAREIIKNKENLVFAND